MNSKIVQIGEAHVDVASLRGYTADALGHLQSVESYKNEFKTVVELASEELGLDKKLIGAYFKARHAEQTKVKAEQGEVFGALDAALDE